MTGLLASFPYSRADGQYQEQWQLFFIFSVFNFPFLLCFGQQRLLNVYNGCWIVELSNKEAKFLTYIHLVIRVRQ